MEDIKIRRVGWGGHIIRMEEERIPKVLNGNFYTSRPVGRPRTRRANVVQRDVLQLLGITGWRRRAENRDEWRRLMGEAKARKGLQRPIWMDGSHKRYDFREKKVGTKCVFISSTVLCETFLVLRINERDMIRNAYWS